MTGLEFNLLVEGIVKLGFGGTALIGSIWIASRVMALVDNMVKLNGRMVDAGEKRQKQIDEIKANLVTDAKTREDMLEETKQQTAKLQELATGINNLVTINQTQVTRLDDGAKLTGELIQATNSTGSDVTTAVSEQAKDIKKTVGETERNIIAAIDSTKKDLLEKLTQAAESFQNSCQEILEELAKLQPVQPLTPGALVSEAVSVTTSEVLPMTGGSAPVAQ
jgi:chromosome segregation ATPase